MKLGDKTFEELGLEVTVDYQHPAAPDTRDYYVQIPGKAGAWDFGADMGVRPFSLPCTLIEKTPAARDKAIRDVTAHLFDTKSKPKTMQLVFSEEPDKYYMVRYSGNLPVSRIIGIGQFTIPLTAFDPEANLISLNSEINWWNQELTWESRSVTWESRGGHIQPFTMSGIYHAFVNGNQNARPLITIVGSANELTLTANGETLTINNLNNETFIIDKYTATKGGANALFLLSGNLSNFYLAPGENPVQIGGHNINVTISIVLRDKFL
jgi:phage-related protein